MIRKNLIIATFICVAIPLTSLAQVGSQTVMLLGTPPVNPPPGQISLWGDAATGSFACLTSAGLPCFQYPGVTADGSNGLIVEGAITAGTTVILPSAYVPTYNIGGTTACNFSQSSTCNLGTVAGNTTLAATNPLGPGPYWIEGTQNGTGGYQLTLPASFQNVPNLYPTAGTHTLIGPIAYDAGSGNYYMPGVSGVSNLLGLCPTGTALASPSSGYLAEWCDSTDNDIEAKDSSGNVYKMLKSGGMVNPVTGAVALSAINPQTATYQVLAADFSNYKTITVASGTFTITLVASGSQPANGQYINIVNYGSGVVTVARSGQNINGGTTSLTIPAASSTGPWGAQIWSDGTNYFATVNYNANTANSATNMAGGTAGQSPYQTGAGATSFLGPGTAKQIRVSGGTSGDSYIDFPQVFEFPAANCVSAVAGAAWNTTLTPTCYGGSNNLGGYLPFVDASTAQFSFQIPGDWDTTQQPYIKIVFGSLSNTTGTVIFNAAVACSAQDGSVTSDPAFNTADALATKTMATASRFWSTTVQLTQVTSGNNCTPGSLMLVKITRATDTASTGVSVEKAVITVPRLLVVQAN